MKDDHATLLRPRTPPELAAEDVVAYLSRHPDFFRHHEQALYDLELPHRAGAAVSLVERQVSLLRERNIDSRQRFNRLLENAHENDQLFARTRRLVLGLLEAATLAQLVRVAVDALRRDFGVEYGQLLLLGPRAGDWPEELRVLDAAAVSGPLKGLVRAGKPVVGPLRAAECALLFAADAGEVRSAAVVPIGTGEPAALLVAGSSDARRFHGEMGTLFLEFIAEVLARLLPRHLARD
jgi:hypothetical protein